MRRTLYLKPEVRILGISDGGKVWKRSPVIHVVGVVFRGRRCLEGVMGTIIPSSSQEATPQIIRMVRESKHYKQLRIIICDGLAVGKSSKIDLSKLSGALRLPVISLVGKRRIDQFQQLLLRDPRKRWKPKYFAFSGLDGRVAEQVLMLSTAKGGIPEQIRTARLIVNALTRLRSSPSD